MPIITTWVDFGVQRFIYKYREIMRCDQQLVRDIFNDNFYFHRAAVEQEFEQYVVYQQSPSDDYEQPSGTTSEIAIYHQRFDFVAEVHQYVLPEGVGGTDERLRLGASGEPDPRELIHEDEIYYRAQLPKKPRFLRGRQSRH